MVCVYESVREHLFFRDKLSPQTCSLAIISAAVTKLNLLLCRLSVLGRNEPLTSPPPPPPPPTHTHVFEAYERE